MNRERGGGPGSDSGNGRAENELNVGANSRGEWREVVVLGVGGVLEGVYDESCCAVRIPSVPKREYSGLAEVVLVSGSRSGTDASTEIVRLWTSLRLLMVVDVTSLEEEPSACFFLRLAARRRAKGTTMRTRATMKIMPPTAATMMIVSVLFLAGDWLDEEGVELG